MVLSFTIPSAHPHLRPVHGIPAYGTGEGGGWSRRDLPPEAVLPFPASAGVSRRDNAKRHRHDEPKPSLRRRKATRTSSPISLLIIRDGSGIIGSGAVFNCRAGRVCRPVMEARSGGDVPRFAFCFRRLCHVLYNDPVGSARRILPFFRFSRGGGRARRGTGRAVRRTGRRRRTPFRRLLRRSRRRCRRSG